MAGCFGSSAVDRWMEGQLNSYLDRCDSPFGEWDLTLKLPNSGTVKVYVNTEQDYDEGHKCGLWHKIERVHWTFDPDGDINMKDLSAEHQTFIEEEVKKVGNDY